MPSGLTLSALCIAQTWADIAKTMGEKPEAVKAAIEPIREVIALLLCFLALASTCLRFWPATASVALFAFH